MNEDDLSMDINVYDDEDYNLPIFPSSYSNISNINPQRQTLESNNGWNKQIEDDARSIGERSEGLRWMHNKASGYFLWWYWFWALLNIFLAAVVVTFNSITGAECVNNTFDPFKIISIVGGALVGICTTIASIRNYGARVTAHQVSEGNFQALFYTIKNQLHLNRKDRQFGKDFIEWVQKEYTDLSSNPDAPNIPGKIEAEYSKLIEGMDIAKYNDIEGIDIKTDSPRKDESVNLVPQSSQSLQQPLYRNDTSRRRNIPSRRQRPRQEYRTQSTSRHTASVVTSNNKNNKNNKNNNNPRNVEDHYTITIPEGAGLSAKDKWQLERFYREKTE